MGNFVSDTSLPPAGKLEAVRGALNTLEVQIARQSSAIVEMTAVLERLKQALADGDADARSKALSQAGTQLMVFQLLSELIASLLEDVRRPVESALATGFDQNTEVDGQQLSALSDVADALASSFDPTEVLYRAMDSLVS